MAVRTINKKYRGRGTYVVPNGVTVEKGNIACLDTATGGLANASVATTLWAIGHFLETATGVGTAVSVEVDFFEKHPGFWFRNATVNPCSIADIGKKAYLSSPDQITATATGASQIGRILDFDATKGVFVVPLVA